MDEKQKEELREIIEGQASGNYEGMITAKENIDEIARSVKNLFGITPGHFKKLVKLCYEDSIEAERRKFAELDDLYIDLFEPGIAVEEFDPELKTGGGEFYSGEEPAGTPCIDKIDSWQDQTPYQAGEIDDILDELSASSEELERHEKIVERFNDELLKDETITKKGVIK